MAKKKQEGWFIKFEDLAKKGLLPDDAVKGVTGGLMVAPKPTPIPKPTPKPQPQPAPQPFCCCSCGTQLILAANNSEADKAHPS